MQRFPNQRVGIAWYSKADWPGLRAAAVDREGIEDTYEEWLQVAESSLHKLADAGIIVERVPVRLADLEEWCRAQGRPLDAAARADFTSRSLQLKYEGGSIPPN